jgi:hypothetical protein
MTAPRPAAAALWALVCRDPRRPAYGNRWGGLSFPSAAAAHEYVDAVPDATRAEWVRDGWRVRPIGDDGR